MMMPLRSCRRRAARSISHRAASSCTAPEATPTAATTTTARAAVATRAACTKCLRAPRRCWVRPDHRFLRTHSPRARAPTCTRTAINDTWALCDWFDRTIMVAGSATQPPRKPRRLTSAYPSPTKSIESNPSMATALSLSLSLSLRLNVSASVSLSFLFVCLPLIVHASS